MPQRTNEFQELVSLIQRALAPKGAKITDSAMVNVPGMKAPREIDVLIETDVGPYQIKIAVEAKNESRKFDSTKLDAIIGKYRSDGGVKVDKIVVITQSGFYQPVIERAQVLGIELLTLNQAISADWANLYPRKIQLCIPPHICSIQFEPPIESISLNEVLTDGRVFCSHGTEFGVLKRFAKIKLSREFLPHHPNLLQILQQKAAESGGESIATITFPLNHDHIIRVQKKDYPLKQITAVIHYVDDTASLEYSTCQLASPTGEITEVPFALATVGGKKLQFAMPDGMKSEQIILRIDSANTTNCSSDEPSKKQATEGAPPLKPTTPPPPQTHKPN